MGLKMVGWSCLSCKLTTLQCWMTQGHRYHRIFWWSSVDYPWAMLILEFLSSNRTCKGELQLGYNTRKGLAQNKKTSIKPLLIRSPFFSLAAKEKHTIWWPSKGLGERPWGICAGQQPWKICAILGHRSLTPSTFFSLSLANPRYSCKELHRLQRTGVQIIVQVQNNSLNQISIEPRIQQVASNPNTPVHQKKKIPNKKVVDVMFPWISSTLKPSPFRKTYIRRHFQVCTCCTQALKTLQICIA